MGCLYIPFSHPQRERIYKLLLISGNKGTHQSPLHQSSLFELSPIKIHAIKSLNSTVWGDILELVEDIIHILETVSMNHIPREVKMSVEKCDITAHEYNKRTLIGASDSMLGYCVGHFPNMNIDNYQLNPECEGWIACRQKTEPEPTAATYTSLNNNEDGYDNNYISRALLCGTGPVTQQDFTIQDAVNMGLRPNYKFDGRGCWICPLCCLYVPADNPQREEFHQALPIIANKGSHPIYDNHLFFELSPNKIHAIKSINTKENLTDYIIHLLHNISLNHLLHNVEMFFRDCNTTKHQYNQSALIGSVDCLMGSSGNPATNLGNLDFFSELTATPEDCPAWLAYK